MYPIFRKPNYIDATNKFPLLLQRDKSRVTFAKPSSWFVHDFSVNRWTSLKGIVKRVSDTNSRYKRFFFIRSIRFRWRIWISVHDCAAISRSSCHVTRLAGTKWRPHVRKLRKRLQTLAYRVFRENAAFLALSNVQ